MKTQIKSLKKELNEIKLQNQKLEQENANLINKLEIEKNKINASQIKSKKNDNSDSIIDLYEEIHELKEKLSRYPYELSDGEKLMSVIITSPDQKIHFSYICKNTTSFNRIEEDLYKDFPDYKENENYFLANGNKINKFKTMEENKINNSDIIELHPLEIE